MVQITRSKEKAKRHVNDAFLRTGAPKVCQFDMQNAPLFCSLSKHSLSGCMKLGKRMAFFSCNSYASPPPFRKDMEVGL